MSDVAYKILTGDEWRTLDSTGRFDGAPVDLADGYVHLSAPDQLAGTAAKHFAGRDGLVLAAVDLTMLDAVVWEPSRGGQLFPHLYGPLPRAAVTGVQSLSVDADGAMTLDQAASF